MPKKSKRRPAILVTGIGLVGSLVTIVTAGSVYYQCAAWGVIWFVVLYWLGAIRSVKNWPTAQKLAAALLLSAVAAAIGFPFARAAWRTEKARASEGELKPADTLPNVPMTQYAIEIGTVHARFTFDTINHEPWVIGQRDRLRFDTDEDGNMLFSTVIRDNAGNIIVEINKNAWRVSKQENECWDKNYSSDRLEVLDGKGVPVLQVKLFTNGVQLQGVWHMDNGEGFTLVQLGPHGPQSLIQHFPASSEGKMPEIPKAFKYPSREHWGDQVY